MTEVVIATYRPRPGGEAELRSLLSRHVDTLRREQLVSDRPPVVLRSRVDGTYLEIFEWLSAEAVERAPDHPDVQAIWGRMADVAEFVALDTLQEAHSAFPHFDLVVLS